VIFDSRAPIGSGQGVYNDDHNILAGSWGASTDGMNWEHDFNIKYTKIDK
jgi:hypothetical protein